jgi:hypothetical protein
MALSVDHHIIRLQVAIHDLLVVEKADCTEDFSCVKCDPALFLVEIVVACGQCWLIQLELQFVLKDPFQVLTMQKFEDKTHVLFISECVHEVDNKISAWHCLLSL